MPEKGRFCPKCGKEYHPAVPVILPVKTTESEPVRPSTPKLRPAAQTTKRPRQERPPVKKKNNRNLVIAVIILVALVLIVASVLVFVFLRKDPEASAADHTPGVSQSAERETRPAPAGTTQTPEMTEPAAEPTTEPTEIATEPETALETEAPTQPSYDLSDPYSFTGDYYCPDSDVRYYTEADVAWMEHDREYLQMAINEIYARHGYSFQTPEIREYFESKSWYTPVYAPGAFDGSVLSTCENANIALFEKLKAPK